METKNSNICDRIEPRSEKVRNIIGAIPSLLAYWSIAVIIVILVGLILAVCFIPYPYGNGETILQHLFSH